MYASLQHHGMRYGLAGVEGMSRGFPQIPPLVERIVALAASLPDAAFRGPLNGGRSRIRTQHQ